jgi:hypothetical protein
VGCGAETGEGGEVEVDELKKKRFLWGILLVCAPWIPTLIGLGRAFRGISEQKATGLGAIGAGLTESFLLCGIGAILVGQVTAIVLLFRAFSSGHWLRSSFSVLSIGLSALMFLLVCLFLWFSWFQAHRSF